MLGTLVNVLSVLLGTFIGVIFHKGMPKKVNDILMTGLGLSVLLIGFQSALKTNEPLLLIISLCLGGTFGVIIGVQDKLEAFALRIQNKLDNGKGTTTFAEGLVTATMIYCVGAMAIMGSIESGLNGNHQILFIKSLLDGIASIALGSTLGWGVAASTIPLFLYQGSITLCARFIAPYVTDSMITELSAVGGLLVVGIGLSLLNIKKVRTADLLPSIVLPILYFLIQGLF